MIRLSNKTMSRALTFVFAGYAMVFLAQIATQYTL